jgi:hypothetical protein
MSLIPLYFGMRSASSWSWGSFVRYYDQPDAPFRWRSALESITNSKESQSDEANRAKAAELLEQYEDSEVRNPSPLILELSTAIDVDLGIVNGQLVAKLR